MELESKDAKSGPYREILDRLRAEPFNTDTNQKLCNHPIVLAAKDGTLTKSQERAFVCEQFAIQRSDACSFAALAGHLDFCPASLALVTALPEPKVEHDGAPPDLFQFLLGGELFASGLLLKHAKALGLDSEEAIRNAYQPTARAQAYPSFWSRLALSKSYGAAAAACAVNFPAWGSMCRELLVALRSNQSYGYSGHQDAKEALGFIEFFATPIENLDEMALAIMERDGVTYDDVVDSVRLLQEYEVMFWDAVYNTSQISET